MSGIDLMFGGKSLIVGVEQDPDETELTRVYIDSRGLCRYVLVKGESAEAVKRAWGSTAHHLMMPTPAEVYIDDEQIARNQARNDEAAKP